VFNTFLLSVTTEEKQPHPPPRYFARLPLTHSEPLSNPRYSICTVCQSISPRPQLVVRTQHSLRSHGPQCEDYHIPTLPHHLSAPFRPISPSFSVVLSLLCRLLPVQCSVPCVYTQISPVPVTSEMQHSIPPRARARAPEASTQDLPVASKHTRARECHDEELQYTTPFRGHFFVFLSRALEERDRLNENSAPLSSHIVGKVVSITGKSETSCFQRCV
jgi:hypothetical protein